MKIKINGVVVEKLKGKIQDTDWYQYEHPSFDLVENFYDVQNICKDSLACYLDSFNWSIMNKTELTASIYKFITHRVYVIKDGFANNFLPDQINWDVVFNFIDWSSVLSFILFLL